MAHIEEVTLFDHERGPFGDALENPLRPGSYHFTTHGIVADGGFQPYFVPTAVDLSAPIAQEWSAPVQWEDSNGHPIALFAGGASVARCMRIDPDGTIATDKTFTGKTIDPTFSAVSMALHDNGSTAPLLLVGFGTSGDFEYRTKAGVWAAAAGSPSQVQGFFSENGNLWGIINDYQVQSWPAGTNPATGTAGGVYHVGNAAWPITGRGLLARSYVVFTKPDGIYVFDIDAQRFENIWPGLADHIHPDTGKGTRVWGSDLYVPFGQGGMVRVTPALSVIPASPLGAMVRKERKTPGRVIRGIVGDASYLWGASVGFRNRLGSEIDLFVWENTTAGGFVDRTAAATDGDSNTGFAFDLSAAGAELYLGADTRTAAIHLLSTVPATESTAIIDVAYYNGSWAALTHTDYTAGLGRPGVILPDASVPGDWAQNDVNGETRYWLRVTAASGTAQSVTIQEARLLPEETVRTGGENVEQAARDEAGLTTHIIRGYPAPTVDGFFWEDVATIDGDYSLGLIFSKLLSAGADGRNLIALGPRGYVRLPVGDLGVPDAVPYSDVTNSFASMLRLRADTRISQNQRAPGTLKHIEYLDIYVEDFDNANDTVQAWVLFNGVTRQFYGVGRSDAYHRRIRLEAAEPSAVGHLYAAEVAFQDGAVGATVPKITRVVAGVYAADRRDSG